MILFEKRAAKVLYKVLKKIQNKKFLLPLNVCPIVPDTFKKANKEFKFIDIDLKTLCMDEKLVLKAIKNDKTIDGLLFVKTFGISLDVQPLFKKVKKLNKNIFIIDDMCPCRQEFDYDIDNSYANMALFSSGYSKYVDIGYGGYGFLKDNEFLNIFKDKSQNKNFLKYKKKIEKQLPLMDKHKNKMNKIYSENLPKNIFLGKEFNGWRFSLLVNNKDKILQKIFDVDGLFASSHYPQVDYNYMKKPQENTNAYIIQNKILNLFNDFRYTEEQALYTCKVINNILENK